MQNFISPAFLSSFSLLKDKRNEVDSGSTHWALRARKVKGANPKNELQLCSHDKESHSTIQINASHVMREKRTKNPLMKKGFFIDFHSIKFRRGRV